MKMRVVLKKMGKSLCKGPLIDHGLFPGAPWHVGEERSIKDSLAVQILAKYPDCFKNMGPEEKVISKFKAKDKLTETKEKIVRPKGVK